jgi:hypothetical protein
MTDPMPLGAPDRLELGEGIRWADGRLVCVDILTGRPLTRASQIRPTDWAGYSQSWLEKAIYDYTAQSVRAMRTAGVTPEYVSIGNEINNALDDVSRWTSPADYCALLESASKAVRGTSPTSRSRPW